MVQAAAAPLTEFLSPDRAPAEELARQRRLLAGQPQLNMVADAVPQPLAVINAQRQMVHLNAAGLQMLGLRSSAELAGRRPGEALGCEVAARAPGGCGTGRECRECGAVLSVLEARRRGHASRTCVISRGAGPVPLDLEVTARLLDVEGEPFVLATLTDRHHERRRRVLERLFFHDVLNTAGGLLGLSEANLASVETAGPDGAELSRLMVSGCHQLVEEIGAQRDLAAAECGELETRPARIVAGDAVLEAARTYRHHPVADGRRIEVAAGPDTSLHGDPLLLGRVLGNLLKNALEAVPRGGVVTIGHDGDGDTVTFRVHNPGEVPREVRHHLFERTVSTKGTGRGLGTYSVRLFAEHYLGGRVVWTSTRTAGTTVTVTLPRRVPSRGPRTGP